MCMPIADTCTFEGRKWTIESWYGDIDCIPSNSRLGIKCHGSTTVNYEGRINHFMIHEGKLYLFRVEVELEPTEPPQSPKCDRREVLRRYEPMTEINKDGEHTVINEYQYEYLIYDNLIVPFTGTIEVSYPHDDPWEYPISAVYKPNAELMKAKLKFKDGILKSCKVYE